MRIVNNLSEAAKVSEAWEEFLKTKYGANKSTKETTAFRDYEVAMEQQPIVAKFYKENHEYVSRGCYATDLAPLY